MPINCISAGPDDRPRSPMPARTSTMSNVPIALRPLQQPHPAFWYGSSNTIGSTWAGEQGLHFVTLGPMQTAKENIDAFKAAFAKRGRAGAAQGRVSRAAPPSACSVTSSSPIPTRRRTASASRRWSPSRATSTGCAPSTASTGLTSRLNVPRGADFEECVADGTVIAGTPADGARRDRAAGARARRQLSARPTCSSAPCRFADALRSLQLFSTEVMPKIAHL